MINKQTKILGMASYAVFLASIPFANWWLNKYGLWNAPLLGMLPSALWVVAISFVLRDLLQITLGRKYAWSAIVVGAFLSWWIASPALALASATAFFISESFDAAIFTPLANRGRFLIAVIISGYVAGFVDSALFVRIAFGTWSGWWQLGIAKALVVMSATPVVWMVRRALLR